MKRHLLLLFGLLFFTFHASRAQQADPRQVEAARNFLNAMIRGDKNKAWALFDTTHVAEVSRQQFNSGMDQMRQMLQQFDSFELDMSGMRISNEQQLEQHSFRAVSTQTKVVGEVLVDVLFFKGSPLVAGAQPRVLQSDNRASTSPGRETPIAEGFTATIGGVDYSIKGINIVHFANNEALLAIQVTCSLPADKQDLKEYAQKEAVRFAKYLVANGYRDKARIKATEMGRKLLDDIGVSFFDPARGGGFNVMVKPEEYR